MTTLNNTALASLLVDQEYATIPYSAATLRLNEPVTTRRNATSFSSIGGGRFRRMFNRHATAFRR